MSKKAEWIRFLVEEVKGKTLVWRVETKSPVVILGLIKWYPPWRKYSFQPLANTVFEEDCLRDIADFIVEETEAHKKGRT